MRHLGVNLCIKLFFLFLFPTDFLKRIRGALWFVMEPLMSKNDNFSFGFYKGLVEKVKNKVDAIDEEIYNEVRNFCTHYQTCYEQKIMTLGNYKCGRNLNADFIIKIKNSLLI